MEVSWNFQDLLLGGNVIASFQDVGGPPMSITQTLADGSNPVTQPFNPGNAVGSTLFNGLKPSTEYLYTLTVYTVYIEDEFGDGPQQQTVSGSGETKAPSTGGGGGGTLSPPPPLPKCRI
jgi:hypothetical protein